MQFLASAFHLAKPQLFQVFVDKSSKGTSSSVLTPPCQQVHLLREEIQQAPACLCQSFINHYITRWLLCSCLVISNTLLFSNTDFLLNRIKTHILMRAIIIHFLCKAHHRFKTLWPCICKQLLKILQEAETRKIYIVKRKFTGCKLNKREEYHFVNIVDYLY